ncbi:MAG: hypothetical protein ACR2NN_29095 [Bryobacteraceae bacterium]
MIFRRKKHREQQPPSDPGVIRLNQAVDIVMAQSKLTRFHLETDIELLARMAGSSIAAMNEFLVCAMTQARRDIHRIMDAMLTGTPVETVFAAFGSEAAEELKLENAEPLIKVYARVGTEFWKLAMSGAKTA